MEYTPQIITHKELQTKRIPQFLHDLANIAGEGTYQVEEDVTEFAESLNVTLDTVFKNFQTVLDHRSEYFEGFINDTIDLIEEIYKIDERKNLPDIKALLRPHMHITVGSYFDIAVIDESLQKEGEDNIIKDMTEMCQVQFLLFNFIAMSRIFERIEALKEGESLTLNYGMQFQAFMATSAPFERIAMTLEGNQASLLENLYNLARTILSFKEIK